MVKIFRSGKYILSNEGREACSFSVDILNLWKDLLLTPGAVVLAS